MSREPKAVRKRRRLVDVLRVVAALAWLVLAIAVFRVPLGLVLAPVAKATGLEGILVPAAPGFVLRVVSEPPNGQVWVNGIDRGLAPLLSNVVCREGQPVRIRVVKEGLPPWEREVECREGRTLFVRARLGAE